MNVDCGRRRKPLIGGRVLAACLLLLAAGCVVLGVIPRSPIAAPQLSRSDTISQSSPLPQQASSLAPADSRDSRSLVRARALFTGLPLIFEPNLGQKNLDAADPRAKFVAHGSGYSLFLGSEGAILSLASADSKVGKPHTKGTEAAIDSVEMKLAGASVNPSISAFERLPGQSNYLIGNDPSKWRSGVPQFARVRYASVYPGIDLVFYGNQGHLEYDFQIAPGADPAQAELEFNGAKQLEIKHGSLLIHTGTRVVELEAPRLYQDIAGKRQPVEGQFVLRTKNRAGFLVGSYDRSRELVIDPILTFSTYFGGSGNELSTFVAVDGTFNIYLTGSTTSPDLPVTIGQTALAGAGPNVYVAKISPPLGNQPATLIYATYLGGNGSDTPVGIKVDGGYHPFVAGTTSSTNFPTTNAYQSVPEPGSAGTAHVFVTQLQNNGSSPVYSTYLSGNGTDLATGMTIDALSHVFVTGTTTSTDSASSTDHFPASSLSGTPSTIAFQPAPKGPISFFVTEVNTQAPGVGSIAYSTYFGGGVSNTNPPIAVGGGIAVDSSNNVYFSGTTNYVFAGCAGCSATDFPILNAYQPCLDQAPPTVVVNPPTCSNTPPPTASDAFVAKLNLTPNTPPGQQLLWSSYAGGSGDDSSTGVGIDPGAANVYIVGTTNSFNFVASSVATTSTSAAFQKCLNNTPLTTPSITSADCPQPTTPQNSDAFVARFTNPTNASTTATPTNMALNYFSYLGGANNEAGTAITVDSSSGALITGWTQSPGGSAAGAFPVFPPANAIQSTLNGPQNAFVARLNTAAVVGQTTSATWASYFGGNGTDSGSGIALDANQNTYLSGQTNSTNLQVAKPLPATEGGGYKGGYDAFVAQLGTAVSLSIQGSLTLGTNQTFISAGNPATFIYIVTNNGPDLATNLTLTDNIAASITGVPVQFVTASISAGTCPTGASTSTTISCTIPTLQAGSTVTVTIVLTPTGNANGNQATFNGGTVQVMGTGNIVLAQTSVPAVMSDFTMSVSPTNSSVPIAGDSATYQVQLMPHPLFTSAITVSCSNLPVSVGCSVTPSSSITVQSTSGATATVTLTTQPRPNPTASLFLRRYYAMWLVVPGMVWLFVGRRGGRNRRRIAGVLMLCTTFAMVLLIPACSQTNQQPPASGTPPGNYTVTITAASGSDSKSQTIGFVVP